MNTAQMASMARLGMVRTAVDGKPVVTMTLLDSYKLDAATKALVESLGWKVGQQGNYRITCTTAAEIDAARNPLRVLVA